MANLNEFLAYLNGQVDKGIYVWGAQGQLLKNINETWIRVNETTRANADKAIALWKKRKDLPDARAFDCSGLGTYWLYNLKHVLPSDMTAQDIKVICNKINKADLRAGDFVFKCGITGKANHIGYVVDSAKNVVEAQGRAYGVVKRSLGAGGWNWYGRPRFWGTTIPTPTHAAAKPQTGTGGNCEVTTKVVKKGVKGEVVKTVQILLNAYIGAGLAVDGSCGPATEIAIKKFQKANGLAQDGHCGPATWNRLING